MLSAYAALSRPTPTYAGLRRYRTGYRFAIGSAGSCPLVLQTLLPALLHADGPSTVRISGGTHNAMAPPVHFLQRAYGRILEQMGAEVEITLQRYGFHPAGSMSGAASAR